METEKIILGSLSNKVSRNNNNFLSLELKQNNSLLGDSNFNYIINLDEQTILEKNLSRKYRLTGKINLLTSNILFNNKPKNSDLDFLLNNNTTSNNFILQIGAVLKKDYYYNITDINNAYTSQSQRGIQIKKSESFLNNKSLNVLKIETSQKHNLSVNDYVYFNQNNDIKYLKVDKVLDEYTFLSDFEYIGNIIIGGNIIKINNITDFDINYSNFISVVSVEQSDISGNTNNTGYAIITINSLNNNIEENNFIDLRSNNFTISGLYKILNKLSVNKFIIGLNINGFTNLTNTSLNLLIGKPSEYYVRKLSVLTTNDYHIHNCGYSENIYPNNFNELDNTANADFLFEFTKTLNLDIIDYRNVELSDIYLIVLKRSGQNTYNWSNVTAIWDFNKLFSTTNNSIETVSRRVNNNIGTIEKINVNDEYVMDFVELNTISLEETVLSKVYFRFSNHSVNNGNSEGYYYNPFFNIKIRDFSETYINTTIDNIVDIEENKYWIYKYNDTDIIIKKLLDITEIELLERGVDYPFKNGCHYLYNNFTIYFRRQLPPSILIGEEFINFDTTC
jgi:hypothetical protein